MTDISDYLMKEAAKADEKADKCIEQAEQIKLGLDYHLAGWRADLLREDVIDITLRAHFHRGQASGFRQATFVVIQHVGTPAND